MGRCGCSSSAASGAAIGTAPCITAAGAGTPASPFILSPRIDPDVRNLLSCGSAGLLAPDPDNPGVWTSYTPTWSSDGGGQPSIGNGTLVGLYRKRGHSLELLIELVVGSTSGVGTGFWRFSLPAGLVSGFASPLAFQTYDTSPGNVLAGVALAVAGENVVRQGLRSDGLVLGGALAYGANSFVIIGGTVYTTT